MASHFKGFHLRILDVRLSFSSDSCVCRRAALRPQAQHRLHPSPRFFRGTAFSGAKRPSTPAPGQSRPLKPAPTAVAPPSPRHTKTPSLATAAVPTRLLAARLAAKGVPTVLYEAPSHFWYIGSCVGAGCFLFAFAAGQYNLVAARPPEGVVWWAPPFFGAMIIIFGAMGTAFILRARGIVAMIRAVPAASAAAAGKQAGKQAAGWLRGSRVAAKAIAEGGGETGPLLIEVTVKNLVPFRARRPMLYKPEEVRLPYPLAEPMAELAARAAAGGRRVLSAAERLAEEEKKKAYLQYDRDHLLTAPFRHLFKVVKAAFRGLRKGLSGEGVIKIKTKDDTLRLDLDGGWALDHGRALDKLLKVGSLP